MIRRVRLHPYKVHEETELADLPPISVLVGRNNSGKSSILYSMTLLKYGLSWVPWLPNAPTSESGISRRTSEVDIDYGDSSGRVSIKLEVLQGAVSHTVQDGSGSTSGVTAIPDAADTSGPSGPLIGAPAASKSTFFLSAYRAAPDRSFEYVRFPDDVGYDGANCWNILHQLKANDRPEFAEVVGAVSDLGFGVESVKTPTAAPGRGALRLGNFGRSDELPFLGSGVATLLPVVTQATLCSRGDTLLVEEPEMHLHTGALGTLWRQFGKLASEKGVQLFVTTHSIDFVGSLIQEVDQGRVPESTKIYLVDRGSSGKTTVNPRDVGFLEGEDDPLDAARRVVASRN